jgi:hypothetical protein
MNTEKQRLDDLLAKLPLPATLPRDGSTATVETNDERWARQLERTLARVRSDASSAEAAKPYRADLELDNVLRTPLPLEACEPAPNQSADAESNRTDPDGFDGIFSGEALDTDPLRAPLKSGEHAHLRPVESRQPLSPDLPTPHRQRQRFSLTLVLGGATTLVAAAAALGLFIRSERQSTEALRLAALETASNAVVAPNQPTAENGNYGQDVIAVGPQGQPLPAPEPANAAVVTAPIQPLAANHAAAAKAAAPRDATAHGHVVSALTQAEPELLPAAGPSELPDHPSMGAILAAFARRQGDAKRCLPPNTSGTHVALTFANTGKVAQIAVVNSALDATTQNCIRAALGTIQVEPFAKKQYDATLPLSSP